MYSLEIPLCESPAVAGVSETVVERSADPALRRDRAITNVFASTLTLSRPAGNKPVPVVLICPGGGYASLMIDKEGHDVARWLNGLGIAAAVLKYRLPHPEAPSEDPWPLEDAREALRILFSRAPEWGLREDAIGIFGGSAGGHLAAYTANRPCCRPHFQILLYPVISFLENEWTHTGSRRNLLGGRFDPERCLAYSAEKWVAPLSPPAFVVHAQDDGVVHVEHSRRYCAALRASGVPCEYLELSSGGHGFGLGIHGGEPQMWPERCAGWLRKIVDERAVTATAA